MKHFLLFLLMLCAASVYAVSSDELVKFIPRDSFIVISADLAGLKDNEVFLNMERRGQIWSYEEHSDITKYFQLLNIDPKKDVKSFVFSRYVNAYGANGKLHIVELVRPPAGPIQGKTSTKYLNSSLVRLSNEEDLYAVDLGRKLLGLGGLNEVKMAVDVGQGKLAGMIQNPTLSSLYQKLPSPAAVWGIAIPLSRRQAAAVKAKQSTNAMLAAFENYYFYCVPARAAADTHFFGQTTDEKQAAFATAFMTGTLLVAKFRAQESLVDVLDRVDIKQTGNSVHITATITKEVVDAYFDGKLGL